MSPQRWCLVRPALAGLVLLAHVALLWLPAAPPHPTRQTAAADQRVTPILWLRGQPTSTSTSTSTAKPPQPGQTNAAGAVRAQSAPARPKPGSTRPRPAERAEPAALGQAITLTTPDRPASAAARHAGPGDSPDGRPEAPPPTPAATPQPLRLALPDRRASAPPAAWAAQDQRLAAPASPGARWAAGLATERPWREQPIDGGMRLRRGQDCLVVRPARDTALNPFNSSTNGPPKTVGAC